MHTTILTAIVACVLAAVAEAQLTGLPCYESNLGTNLGRGDDQVAAGIALGLDAQAGSRPVLGSPFTLVLASVAPASTFFGIMVFSFRQLIPGVDLTPLGMPGCTQIVSLDATRFFRLTPLPQLTVGIPNRSVMVGYPVCVQAATLTPGANPLGALVSTAG